MMHTVQVCKSTKKLKMELDGLKYLDKYDINNIGEKYQFDRNYLIKMKGELNFLKEGFAKYYFNINNDQTPFLLKASEKSKIDNDKDPFVHLIPIDKDLKNEIMECSYYIYQELIAYQNEKVNNKILRCISPLKRIKFKNKENEEEPKVINGKEDKDNNININSDDNIIIPNKNNSINHNNRNLILNLKKASSSTDNNNILIKDDNICIENREKDKEENEIKDNINNNKDNKTININMGKKDIFNMNRNDKRFKTGNITNQKNNKIDYKNIFMNYKINDRNIKRKTNINRKKHNLDINKLLINDENNIFSENNKNIEENRKKTDKNLEKFLVDKKENENKNEKNE